MYRRPRQNGDGTRAGKSLLGKLLLGRNLISQRGYLALRRKRKESKPRERTVEWRGGPARKPFHAFPILALSLLSAADGRSGRKKPVLILAGCI